MDKIKKRETLSLLSGNKLEEKIFDYDPDLLDTVASIANYRSELFQDIYLSSHNEFEINVLLEPIILTDLKVLKDLDIGDIEKLFVQFYAVNDFLTEYKQDFIDLCKFTMIKKDAGIFVKFEIQLLNKMSNYGIDVLINLFRTNKYFSDLSFSNIKHNYKKILNNRVNIDDYYLYKYNEFSSNFLNLYNIENIRNNSNTVIRIITNNININRIIKSSLYSNIYSGKFIFINIDKRIGNILEYIIDEILKVFNNKKYEFLELINILEKYLLQSSMRAVIFFINRILTVEENDFFKYLLNMTKLKNIIIISFDIDINSTIDLELNEKPINYFVNNKTCNTKAKKISSLKNVLKKESENDLFYNKLLSDIKSDVKNIDFESLRALIIKLISSEQLQSAEKILKKITNSSFFVQLKIAQIHRINRNYRKLEKALKTFPSTLPKEYKDEYNYLNFYFEDRFGKPSSADVFYNKIKDIYYINLANTHLSERFIKRGNLKKAYEMLKESKKYFNRSGFKIEELEIDGQIAKYYREIGEKDRSENLYKSAVFYSEKKQFFFIISLTCFRSWKFILFS